MICINSRPLQNQSVEYCRVLPQSETIAITQFNSHLNRTLAHPPPYFVLYFYYVLRTLQYSLLRRLIADRSRSSHDVIYHTSKNNTHMSIL